MERRAMFDDIRELITAVVREADAGGAFWKSPLVAVVSAENGRFVGLKRSVGERHLLPADVLPGAKGIVVYFVPFADRIAASNIPGRSASAEWAEAYLRTNKLIADISDAAERLMGEYGYRTGKIPATHNFDERSLISDWSHRHVAEIAGLGSFGLNNMLITDGGCCGRLGSIVTDCEFPAAGGFVFRERCLNKLNGSCGICRIKCVADAYRPDGFNRHECYSICLENAELHKSLGFADVCGKCLVGLPCSLADPSARESRAEKRR
jgi:epoxyqueuosine reductase QueG